MAKEVRINNNWYWELDRLETAVFYSGNPAFFWDISTNHAVSKNLALTVKISGVTSYPYIADDGTAYEHAALLSSAHDKPEERKSRRCTKIELAEWLAKGNGMWQSTTYSWDTSISVPETTFDSETETHLKIRRWDGKPMEPTAENMGLQE